MNYSDFLKLRSAGSIPTNLRPLLQALLLDAQGDWDAAHCIAQEDYSTNGSWVHAYLHREDGDLANAGYWYRNAGRPMPYTTLEEEWEEIARELILEKAAQ